MTGKVVYSSPAQRSVSPLLNEVMWPAKANFAITYRDSHSDAEPSVEFFAGKSEAIARWNTLKLLESEGKVVRLERFVNMFGPRKLMYAHSRLDSTIH